MADGIYFSRQNAVFNKLFKDLDKFKDDVINTLDAEMNASVQEMATMAKREAPVDQGLLRNSIIAEKDPDKKLSYNLKANARYAAYVEFGTGPAAEAYVPSLDPDWQEYAIDFKKTNPGHTIQKPFFYPSVNKIFPMMIKRMQELIKK
jgi:HK97 gp10 family phage protein